MTEAPEDISMERNFTIEEVKNCLKNLPNKKAPGPDGIQYELLKEGAKCQEFVKKITEIFNTVLNEGVRPERWSSGNIVSIYKGKGVNTEVTNQRGISLTDTILKVYEKLLTSRIMRTIKKNTTPLQGGGKEGEDVELFLLMLNSIIEACLKMKVNPSLVITDIAKAFDKADRVGVFYNLACHGITGKVLKSIWEINNNLVAKIKEGDVLSDILLVEGALRQGSGLSSTNYGQHAGKVIEDQEEMKKGFIIIDKPVPAIGWQDDVTSIIAKRNEGKEMMDQFYKSTVENCIKRSEQKCKCITFGKKKKEEEPEELYIGNFKVPPVKSAKILGFTYDEENSTLTHLKEKEDEIREMVASMGLSLERDGLNGIFMASLIIIYRRVLLPKLLFGLSGRHLKEVEKRKLQTISNMIFKNFANLAQSTPTVCIQNEFGILPINLEVAKRRLNLWKKMQGGTVNPVIAKTHRMQVRDQLSWFQDVMNEAQKIGIKLEEERNTSEVEWKRKVNEGIRKAAKEDIRKELEGSKRCSEIIEDEITPETPKKYMRLTKRKASVFFKARSGMMDPKPREPKWDHIWKCKFCWTKEQSTRHYVKECKRISHLFENEGERETMWKTLKDPNNQEESIDVTVERLILIYEAIDEDI